MHVVVVTGEDDTGASQDGEGEDRGRSEFV